MRRLFLILLVALYSAGSIIAQSSKDTTFFRRGELKFMFLPDSTYRFFVDPCDICPQLTPNNIQSFGQYYLYKDKTYYLYSDTSLATQQACDIVESREDNDNLTFRFHIPCSNNKEHLLRNWLVFNVTLYLMPDSLEWKLLRDSYVPNDTNIKTFYTTDTFLVIPKPSKPVWYYKVKVFSNSNAACIPQFSLPNDNRISSDNNVFDIYMPMVTPEFFLYERFYSEPLTIIDKNAILFRRWVLLKEGVFKPTQYTEFVPLPKKYWKYVNGSIETHIQHFNSIYRNENE